MSPANRSSPSKSSSRWLPRLAGAGVCLAALAGGIAGGLWAASQRPDPLAEARREVADLKPLERQQLKRRHERFAELKEEQQEKLHQMAAAIDADPDAEQLNAVLNNYYQWVTTLSFTQRPELLDLAGDTGARLAKIDDYINEQNRRAAMGPEDSEALVAWLEETAPQELKDLIEASRDTDRRRRLLWHAMRWSEGQPNSPTEADFQALAGRLTPEAKRRLQNASTLEQKRRLLKGWVIFIFYRYRHYEGFRQVSEEELTQFFEQLPDNKRQELLQISSPEYRARQLRSMYLESKYPDRPFRPFYGSRRRGSGPPGRDGDGERREGERRDDDRPPERSEPQGEGNARQGEGAKEKGPTSQAT